MADRDYDIHSATELIVNDFDDERTLDEEEALEGSEDSHNELSNLQKEGDMPLKDLLAMYGYGDPSMENSNSSDRILPVGSNDTEAEGQVADKAGNDADADDDEDDEDDEDEDEDDEDDEDDDPASAEPDLKQFYTEMVKGEKLNNAKTGRTTGTDRSDSNKEQKAPNASIENVCEDGSFISTGNCGTRNEDRATSGGNSNSNGSRNCPEGEVIEGGGECTSGVGSGSNSGNGGGGSGSSRLLRSVSRPQSEEEEDDCDYSPDEEEWKKTIMVGSDYQAAIPEGLCRYDDALPYENEDKMLWDPSHIPEEETEEFLERAQLPIVKGTTLPSGSHIRDDEQALYLLLQCGYNLEEALRRRRMNVLPPTDAVSLWSEEECHNFESGLRNYGKDFHLIQKNKVRTRSVGELVQFYYLWKKSERHDIFTYKARLEKKKYALHPGITDYMDRFLEEQEGVRDRSSSPNVHCLLYGDSKRQRTNAGLNNVEDLKSLESWDGVTVSSGDGATVAASSVASSESVDPLATEINSTSQSQHSVAQVTPAHNSISSTNFNSSRSHLDYTAHLIRDGNTGVGKTNITDGSSTSLSWTSGPVPSSGQQRSSNHLLTTSANSESSSRSPENIISHMPP